MKKFFTLLLFLGITVFGQTTYYWRDVAEDGSWNNNNNWWNGSSYTAPQGTDIIEISNNTFTAMTNDLPSGTRSIRHKIRFGAAATTPRTVSGSTENSFVDYGTVWPFIQNLSSVNHTIAFRIKGSPSYSFEIRPEAGDLTISGDFDNNKQSIVLYSPSASTKSAIFSGVVSNEGKFIVTSGILGKISGASTFTGNVEIDNGEFWLQNGATIGAGTIYIGNGAQQGATAKMWLDDADGGTTSSRSIVVNQGNAGTRYLGGLVSSGLNIYSGSITNNSFNGLIVDVPSFGTSMEISGSLSGNKIIKTGLGNAILSGSSGSFTSNLEIDQGELWFKAGYSVGAGTVYLGNGTQQSILAKIWIDDADGGTTVSRNITVNPGEGAKRSIGGLNTSGTNYFSGNIDLSQQTGLNRTDFSALNSGGTVEFSGIISGAGSGIYKIGPGTIIFSGNNTYSGATDVSFGKLILQGSGNAGTGAMTVASGATLESSVSLNNSSIVVNGTLNVTDNISINALTINSGGTVNVSPGKTLTIRANQNLTVNSGGTFSAGTGSKVAFAGASTISGTIVFYDVDISGGVNFGSASTINGTLDVKSNGFVDLTNAPIYATNSTLKYSSGGTYNRYAEWLSSGGKGLPYNVQISNGTTLNLATNGGTNQARSIGGTLTIDLNSKFRMQQEANNSGMIATLTVAGNVINNGTLELSPAEGGNIIIGGNFTQNGTFTNNSRTVTLNGTSLQTLSGTGALDFHTLSVTNSGSGAVLGKNISVSNSATVSGILDCSTFAVTGAGTFTLNSGATLNIGSTDGIAGTGSTGNIQTTTRSFSTGANYIYDGSLAQITGSGLPATINKLTLNNSNGISLSQATIVTSELGLTSGKLTLGSNSITLGSAGTVTGTPSSSAMVVATGTGKLKKMFAGTGSFTYPVGDATNYTPVTLNFTGGTFDGTTYADVNLTASAHPNLNPANSNFLKRYWTIGSNVASPTAQVTLKYVDNDINGVETNFVVGRWTGTAWSNPTFNGRDPDNNTITATTAGFSDFTGGDAGALPVELTSFNAAIRNGMVDLKWETKTEINNYGFEVERKSATADWGKIGFVEGHGSSNSPKYYSFSDKPSGTGKFSYRLKQIDNDGQFEYSPIVEVLVDNLPNGFVLEQNYPNPFNPETSIRFALKQDTKASLKVFNAMGEEVATLFDGIAEAGRYYDVKFSGNDLSSGFYIYKLVAGEYVSVKKMLLMK